MKIISLNVGRPRLLSWKGSTFSTGIFKEPVAGRVRLRQTNFDGDRQADLAVHGGPEKAVYAYPWEHYSYWTGLLSRENLAWGSFGENLTTEGLLETNVSVGDQFRIGSATVMVRSPRTPCFKLAAKFDRDAILKEFLKSGYSGYYFSVVEEGDVGPGDEFELVASETATLTIAEVNRLYVSSATDFDLLRRATQVKSLPEGWRAHLQAKLVAAEKEARI